MSSIAAGSAGSSSASALSSSSATDEAIRKNTGVGNSLSGGISFSGIGSGTDFQAMIDQLKKIEEIPKNRLEMWRDDWQRRVNAFQEIIDVVGEANKKLSSMDSLSTFLTKVVSSTKDTAIKAEADADAPLGSYKMNVLQLASNGMVTTKNIVASAKKDVIAPTGCTFKYKYGDKERELTVPQGTSLESFVNIINNDTRNPGVTASLIKSGDGYVFQIQGKETGKEHALTLLSSDIPTMAFDSTNPTANWYDRPSQDALFYLEGRKEQILSSSTNSLTEVIPGMTITLTDVTDKWTANPDGSVQNIDEANSVMLTVTNDAASAKAKVQEFVDTINSVISKIQELTKYDSSKSTTDINQAGSQFQSQKGSILTGNYGVSLLNSQLKSMLTERGKGFSALQEDGTGDVFWTLATIGITVDTDESSKTFGQFVIEEGESETGSPFRTLDEALKHDPEAVARILASDKVVRSNSPDFSYVGMLNKDMVAGGEHTVQYEVYGVPPTVDTVYIDGVKASYDSTTNEWTSMAENSKGLVIRVDNLTDGVHKGTFSVQQGKINEVNEFLKKQVKGEGLKVGEMTEEKGTLMVLKENYLGIIDNIEKKIEKEESRLILWETRMRAQFARLDTLIAEYSNQMSSASAALNSASTNYGGK